MIRTRTCAYQGVRNASFLENLLYVINGWPLTEASVIAKFIWAVTFHWLLVSRRKITLYSLQKSLVAKNHMLLVAKFTRCRSCLLKKSLVTRCKTGSLLVAEVACFKDHSFLIVKLAPCTLQIYLLLVTRYSN